MSPQHAASASASRASSQCVVVAARQMRTYIYYFKQETCSRAAVDSLPLQKGSRLWAVVETAQEVNTHTEWMLADKSMEWKTSAATAECEWGRNGYIRHQHALWNWHFNLSMSLSVWVNTMTWTTRERERASKHLASAGRHNAHSTSIALFNRLHETLEINWFLLFICDICRRSTIVRLPN